MVSMTVVQAAVEDLIEATRRRSRARMETVDDSELLARRTGGSRCPTGKALAYVTDPLADDTVLAGTGSVDLWVRSSKPDVDLEVTISEVRPDGQETYVQSGWLRASQRALDAAASTDLLPVQTHTHADVAPLSARRARAGARAALSRSRTRSATVRRSASSCSRRVATGRRGRSRVAARATRTVTVSRSARSRRRSCCPSCRGIDVSTPLPECGTLRGQPCRDYVAAENRTAWPMSSPVYDVADALRRALRRARSAGGDR